MGANLCTLCGSKSVEERLPHKACSQDEKRSTKKQQQLQQKEEKKVAKVMTKATLDDWLSASPVIVRRDVTHASEIQVLKQSPTKLSPWMSSPIDVEVRSRLSSLARDSLSLDRRIKVKEEEGIHTALNKSQRQKMKRKVSFRLPEEADIIIFWSPEGVTVMPD